MRQGEIKVPDAQAEAGDLSSPMSVGPLNDARTCFVIGKLLLQEVITE
jgi:hypothetical protein